MPIFASDHPFDLLAGVSPRTSSGGPRGTITLRTPNSRRLVTRGLCNLSDGVTPPTWRTRPELRRVGRKRLTASTTLGTPFEVELTSEMKIRVVAGSTVEGSCAWSSRWRGAMLTLPPSVRIHVALRPVDMRAQFDGLAGAVRQYLGGYPLLQCLNPPIHPNGVSGTQSGPP